MDAHHLSASSVKAFLACPAQWRARYVNASGDMSGEAATRGTTFHLALERFVQEGRHLDPDGFGHLQGHWSQAWDEVMRQPRGGVEYLNGGLLLQQWWERQNWDDRQVISTERRTEFMLADAKKPIPFVYIIDRLDETPSGIEVFDYKSGRFMLNHDGLRNDLQAISYATAVWLEHPDQRRYWVTFDYLQGDPIGVAFGPDQCEAHYRFLCDVADEIADSDGDEERLNSQCRFCDRKFSCKALASHMNAGGYLILDNPALVDKAGRAHPCCSRHQDRDRRDRCGVEADLRGRRRAGLPPWERRKQRGHAGLELPPLRRHGHRP